MTNITTPFAGNETTAQVQTKLSAIANYWSGTSTALSGAGSWGVVRAILNNFANAANQINNLELASSFITKLNWLNDSDNMFAPLFSSGQQGLWYDPADLTTEFQLSTGTTPVTAAGDPVGLIYDKREGPVPGPELVTNGDFSGGSTDWTLGTGCTVASGEVTFTGSAINVTLVQTGRPSATYNALYRVDYTVISDTLNAGEFRIGALSGASYFSAVNTLPRTVGANTVYIFAKASGTATAFDFYVTSGATSGSLVVDNISIKEIPGNHALQATTSARPILARVPLTGVRNLLTYSEDFRNTAAAGATRPWVYSNATVNADATIAPDGTSTADLILNAATASAQVNQQNITVGSGSNTYSIYAKLGTVNFISLRTSGFDSDVTSSFDLFNGVVFSQGAGHTASITSVGSGWYRCSVAFSTTSDLTGTVHAYINADGGSVFDPDLGPNGTSTIYIWGAQLEVGATATDYQKVVSQYDVTEAGIGESWRLLMDSSDDHMDVTLPAITGTMVLATPEGTAAYGFSRGAGSYEIGGHTNGAYFPGTALVGQIVRDGAMSAEEITRTVTFWKAKGGGDDYGTVTDFTDYWRNWSEITSFPLVDTSSGTSFNSAWQGCTGLTSFPLIDTSSGTSFNSAWQGCTGLTSFPLIDTSSGTNFSGTWQGCNSLTSFPAINTSSGTNFQNAWLNCSSLTSFPAINTSSGTNFTSAWQGCTSLATFPANVFDTCPATNFTNAFTSTNLSQTSIDNILVSINTAGTSNGTFNQSGGSAPSATGETAIDALRGRGWTVTVTGGY